MAERRPIGDILVQRREELGLTVDRVVSDTKLQRRVIEAFEATDFESMPPRGYAQASLASYARYLRIPPSEILPVFQRQLDAYERDHGRRTVVDTGSLSVGSASGREARGARRQAGASGSGGRAPAGRGAAPVGGRQQRRGDSAREGARDYDRRRAYDVRDLYDDRFVSSRSTAPYGSAPAYGTSPRTDRRGQAEPHSSDRARAFSAASADAGRARQRRPEPSPREVVGIEYDAGYEGGSGSSAATTGSAGRTGRGERRDSEPQRITLQEILSGFADYLRTYKVSTLAMGGAVAIVVLVALLVGVSSCNRASEPGVDETLQVEVLDSSSRPASSAYSSTQLAASVDLAAVPAGTVIQLDVASDAPAAPWVEAYIDNAPAGASIAQLGTTQSWTLSRSAKIMLSSFDGVTLLVNGVSVTPVYDNGSYVLTATVPADQLPAQPEVKEGESPEPDKPPEEGQEADAAEAAADDGSYGADESYDDGYEDYYYDYTEDYSYDYADEAYYEDETYYEDYGYSYEGDEEAYW